MTPKQFYLILKRLGYKRAKPCDFSKNMREQSRLFAHVAIGGTCWTIVKNHEETFLAKLCEEPIGYFEQIKELR